jgi:histidinol-phosphate aminotransferase
MRTIFSVSSMSQVAASAALHDSEHIRRAVENNAEQAEVLTAAMEKLGFPLPETWANFVYCELGRDAAAFADRLRVHGVVIQPLGLWGAPTAIRVSIGTPEQNEKFVQVLKIVANR